MARPLIDRLFFIAHRQVIEGVDTRSLFVSCAPELLCDLLRECRLPPEVGRRWDPEDLVLHTPSGPVRVREDNRMMVTDGIVVYRRVGHVPVQTAKVSL